MEHNCGSWMEESREQRQWPCGLLDWARLLHRTRCAPPAARAPRRTQIIELLPSLAPPPCCISFRGRSPGNIVSVSLGIVLGYDL